MGLNVFSSVKCRDVSCLSRPRLYLCPIIIHTYCSSEHPHPPWQPGASQKKHTGGTFLYLSNVACLTKRRKKLIELVEDLRLTRPVSEIKGKCDSTFLTENWRLWSDGSRGTTETSPGVISWLVYRLRTFYSCTILPGLLFVIRIRTTEITFLFLKILLISVKKILINTTLNKYFQNARRL